MIPSRGYIFIFILSLVSYNLKAQKNKKIAVIHFQIQSIDINKKYKIVISKVPDPSEDTFTIMTTVYPTSTNTTIEFPIKEDFMADLSIYMQDSMISGGSFICGRKPITIKFKDYLTDTSIIGGENKFYFDHPSLLFELPAIIVNNRNYNRNAIKEQYEIAFTNPMLKFGYIEYERNVKAEVKANKEKFFILYTLWNKRANFSTKTLQNCLDLLMPDLQISTYGKNLKAYIQSSKNLFISQTLPLFKVKDINNTSIDSKEFSKQSKYTLIHFWATWCIPCIEQMKNITALANETDRRTLNVINISFDTDINTWKNFVKKDTTQTIHYIDNEGVKGKLAQMFGITAIPRNILIDNEGKIVTTDYNRKQIENLLKINQ